MSDRSEVVVVRDNRVYFDQPGKFALVRAAEWCEFGDEIVLWRGPRRPDEKVETKHLTEVTCRALHVDAQGYFTCTPADEREFYPCPRISEELVDLVRDEAEERMNVFADQHAAETASYIDHEQMVEKLGDEWEPKIWAIGEFDQGFAVNGEGVSKGELDPPEGWVRTDLGGRTDGGEAEIPKSELVDRIAEKVTRKLKIKPAGNIVRRVLDLLYPDHDDYVIWSSGYGDSRVWLSKAAMNALVKIEEEQGSREWSGSYDTPQERRQQKKEEAERKKQEAVLRRQAIVEHRAKLKAGGYPAPRDWSPRGRMPGERD